MPTHSARAAAVAVIRAAQPRPSAEADVAAGERRLAGALMVPIEQVIPDEDQPRRDWRHGDGEGRLAELTESVRAFGILQPLVVHEDGVTDDGRQRYRIVAGGRRHAAAARAGLPSVPVVVRGDAATQVRALQLIENLQRQDLSPLDEARAFQELMDMESLSPPALAARLHLSAQHIRDRLRVLADQALADAVARRQIAVSTAREIVKLPEEARGHLRTRVIAGEAVAMADVARARGMRGAERGDLPPENISNRGQTDESILDERQTLFASGADGIVSRTPGERRNGKQPLFASTGDGVAESQPSAPPGESCRVPVGTTLVRNEGGGFDRQQPRLADDLAEAADRFAAHLAAQLETPAGATPAALLGRMRDHAAFDRWWDEVGERLLQKFLT